MGYLLAESLASASFFTTSWDTLVNICVLCNYTKLLLLVVVSKVELNV